MPKVSILIFVVVISLTVSASDQECELDSNCKLNVDVCGIVQAESLLESSKSNTSVEKNHLKVFGVPGCKAGTQKQDVSDFYAKCERHKCVAKRTNSKRLNDVPSEILKACGSDSIADVNEDFNAGCNVGDLPRAKLQLACNYKNGSWYIFCERGGYGLQRRQFKFSKDSSGKWIKSEIDSSKKEPLKECPRSK